MEYAIISDNKGRRTRCNPSDRHAVTDAVLRYTNDCGIAEYLADWCDLAYAGLKKDFDTIRVEICNA